jgi:starch phosphorylase
VTLNLLPQDVIKTFLDAKPGRKWEELADKVAVQLNDTHPSIGVAELMRLLIDVHGVGWLVTSAL